MVLRSRAVCGTLLMGLAVWFWYVLWGFWWRTGQPMTPGQPKVWMGYEVWYTVAALLFLTGVSGCMLWTALRGNPTRLSARAQILSIVGLATLWVVCLVAAFSVVSATGALAPTVYLILGLCPICVLILLAGFRRKVR